ncbi:TlpA family protein disulfide reductase [Bacteroidota bacterium]
MLKNKLLLILFVLPLSIYAQSVTLKGNAPEYAGTTFTFLTFAEQVTYTEKELGSCLVQENGDFSCTFETEETLYVFLYLGTYEAFIFIEPNKEYELLLPEVKEKKLSDKLNPYFKPQQYHIGVENSSDTELNFQLAYFDAIYSIMLEDNSLLIVNKSRELDVDAAIQKVDSLFADIDNRFFEDFKKYKYASFRHVSYQEKMKSISNTYYLNSEILYRNPAYMDLFNQVYDEYFQYFGRTESGKQIYKDIGKLQSITSLKKTLGQDSILTNDTLKELVILKCLHDEFYNDKFSRSTMLTVLDSLSLQTSVSEHKLIAANIREKVTKLMIGYNPPAFELFDKDSNLVTLDSYISKYVYLGFCTTISYACIKEFGMLQNLYEKHKDQFEIIMICMDENLPQMKRFVEMKNYSFKFLYYGNQSDVFKDYDVRAFPTYYFIDKEGKLAISPAPSPDQNAEFTIFQKMRANGDL